MSPLPGHNGPVVLIATDHDSWAKSLQSVLEPAGYVVRCTPTRAKLLRALQQEETSAVIVQADLADGSCIEVCELLYGDSSYDPCVPIFMTSGHPLTREQRLTALRAGVWECFSIPFDAGEFLGKLTNYSRVKKEADKARAASISAYGTQLYSHESLMKVSECLLAHALRHAEPFAMIVIGRADGSPVAEELSGRKIYREPAMRRLLRTISVAARAQDCIGFLSPQEIAIVSLQTDARGATRLAERLLRATDALDDSGATESESVGQRLVAGCASLSATSRRSISLHSIVDRARAAYQTAQREHGHTRVTTTIV